MLQSTAPARVDDSKEVQSVVEQASRQKELNSLSIFTVIVALATVTMTFGALIAVFIVRSGSGQFWGHIWLPSTLWITTLVLVASSVLYEIGRHALMHDDQRTFFRFTSWAAALGILFLIGQVVAWFQVLHRTPILAHNPHSWFIFLFSGLHGLHIVVGLGGFAYLLKRTAEPASGPKYQMHTRAVANGVALFWHYLAAMWLLLYGLLIFWRA
jgi:cytochrome c oxidase subunit III